MKIHLITIGQKMPDWIIAGFQEYAKRLSGDCTLLLNEIRMPTRNKNSSHAEIQKIIQQEGELMLAKIPKDAHIVALDERGELWDTLTLSKNLKHWQMAHSTIALLIGGPDGLSPECKARAHQHWSLSRLTLPHPLVRVIAAEQLYRAWSINHAHPYHRG